MLYKLVKNLLYQPPTSAAPHLIRSDGTRGAEREQSIIVVIAIIIIIITDTEAEFEEASAHSRRDR